MNLCVPFFYQIDKESSLISNYGVKAMVKMIYLVHIKHVRGIISSYREMCLLRAFYVPKIFHCYLCNAHWFIYQF